MAVVWTGIGALDAITMGQIVKNLYTRLYIYAKREAKMYKYTVVTPTFRGVISGIVYQTITVFGVIGAVSGHREGRKSNSVLQNRGT